MIIHIEKDSQGKPDLPATLELCRTGDTLHIESLIELGWRRWRAMLFLATLVQMGVTIQIDDTDDIVAALLDYDAEVNRQRAASARRKGKPAGGKPRALSPYLEQCLANHVKEGMEPAVAAEQYGVSRATITRILQRTTGGDDGERT